MTWPLDIYLPPKKKNHIQFCIMSVSFIFIISSALSFFFGCSADFSEEDLESSRSSHHVDVSSNNTENMMLMAESVQWKGDENDIDHITVYLNNLYLDRTMNTELIKQDSTSSDDCINCGRETGFLPTPEVFVDEFTILENKDASLALFTWTESENASNYQVMMIKVNEDQEYYESFLMTNELEVRIGLDHQNVYLIYVIAHNEITKQRSLPSEPLFIHCITNIGCGLLPTS